MVYIADSENNRLRRMDASGVSTVAGDGTSGFRDGEAKAAKFAAPYRLAVDGAGRVYISDSKNARIRMYVPSSPTTP